MSMQQIPRQQAGKQKWLASHHWMIIAIISAILVIAFIIITILLLFMRKAELFIALGIIVGLMGTLFSYLQWAYPKPDPRTSAPLPAIAPVAPIQTPIQSPQEQAPTQGPTPNPSSSSSPSNPPSTGTVPEGSSPSPTRGINAEDIFFFNVHLPRIDEFYGREDHRRTLLNRTRMSASTSLIGPRRIGKTWLLHYLRLIAKTQLGSHARVVYIDATRPSCTTVADFTENVIEELRLTGAGQQTQQHGLVKLERVVKSLLARGYPLVLCIDEFEHFSNHTVFDLNFFSGLRALANMGLVLVIASKHPLIEIVGEIGNTSGFFNIFEQRTLEAFTLEEAQAFLTAKGKQAGFTAREQEAFAHYSRMPAGNWPPLRLQLVGKSLLEQKGHAAQGEPDWQLFERRLEETYRGAVMHDDNE